jgi:hypothetical protein
MNTYEYKVIGLTRDSDDVINSVDFRDAVYTYGIQCISDVQNNLRGIPTEEELIAELPLFTDYLG